MNERENAAKKTKLDAERESYQLNAEIERLRAEGHALIKKREAQRARAMQKLNTSIEETKNAMHPNLEPSGLYNFVHSITSNFNNRPIVEFHLTSTKLKHYEE